MLHIDRYTHIVTGPAKTELSYISVQNAHIHNRILTYLGVCLWKKVY